MAANHLFSIRDADKAKYLPEENTIAFHHTAAQLLFLNLRARRDIQTSVLCLTTRVKKPDEDDWGKLKRVLKYLNGTRRLRLTISIELMSVIKWSINRLHNTHWDCKKHGGVMMVMEEGAMSSYS